MTQAFESRADAVRYVVLLKLAAGMRHTLMGELQAVQFATDLAGQMIKRGATASQLSQAVDQISHQTRAAELATRSVIEWLRPVNDSAAEVDRAVDECVRLADEAWMLRGIKATTHIQPGMPKVAKRVFSKLIVTALLALTDLSLGSSDIALMVDHVDGKLVVNLTARPADRTSATYAVLHRSLAFDDVKLLAETHNIPCAFDDGGITLEFEPFAVSGVPPTGEQSFVA